MYDKKLFAHPYARRLRFETLEQRRVLAVTIELSDNLTISPLLQGESPDYVNVSNESSSYTFQSEMSIDVNPKNPLHLAGFSHTKR